MKTNTVLFWPGGWDLLAFLLELAALATLVAWGWQFGALPLAGRLLLALGGATAFTLVWGALLAPRAPVQLSILAHRALKLALFGLTALAFQHLWGPVPAGVFFSLAVLTSLTAATRGGLR